MIWKSIKSKKPIAYQSGCWDGKKSDEILVKTTGGKYHVAVMYEGFIDGSEFCEFYDDRDNEIKSVAYWTEID